MAALKSINKYASAPLAPNELPVGALMLVEIGGQVYRIAASDVGGGPALPAWVTSMPTTDPEVAGAIWADGSSLKVSAGA